MRNYFVHIAGTIVILVSWGLTLLWVWGLHRQWWAIRRVRRLSWQIPITGLGFVALWALAQTIDSEWLSVITATITNIFAIVGLGLALLLPFSGIALTLERLILWIRKMLSARHRPKETAQPEMSAQSKARRERNDKAPAATVDPTRRSFLTKAAVAIPGLAVAASGYGIASSYRDVTVPTVPMRYPNLPPNLEGLRILHLSDIHIGYFVFLKDLEQCLEAADRERPDLVLVSGDISDELRELPDALRMIAQLRPRYGTYASLGNHEYYRGLDTVLRQFDAGPIPLLRESGITVDVGDGKLFIGGTDDPARGGSERNRTTFLQRTVDATLDGAPSEAFHVLMSHRPEGWDEAARNGIELTVAGHYHGGIQMGFQGHGVIEELTPNNYIWGHYERNGTHLYTSAGVGHWLPFRLGCPREAPLYVLTSR